MNNDDFNIKLVAARPDASACDIKFTDAVMKNISNNEIFPSSIRKMNVKKKETFIMKLAHLPKIAIIAIALGGLFIVSGTAYAAYTLLWPKPDVKVSDTSTSSAGRKIINLSFTNCDRPNIASRYELKKDATITPDQVAGVVQAHCELEAVDNWINETYRNTKPRTNPSTKPYTETMILPSLTVTKIKESTPPSMTFLGQAKYGQADKTMAITAQTLFIANGTYVARNSITTNDSVMYVVEQTVAVTSHGNGTSSGSLTTEKLLAVVKLNQPLEAYDPLAWQSLTEIQQCIGNTNDTCLTGSAGAVDLYMNLGAGDQMDKDSQMKEIQGVITEINGKTVTIRSSSGSLFTATMPSDKISDFNKNKSAGYNNLIVQPGTGLIIRYREATDKHQKNISATNLAWIQIQLEMVSKGDPVKAY